MGNMSRRTQFGRWWGQLQGHGLFMYCRLLSATTTIRLWGGAHIETAFASGRPLLWSFWHQQAMVYVLFGDRYLDRRTIAMITASGQRGESLGTLARRMQAEPFPVDMAGNPVQAGRSVLNVVRALRQGKQSFIAPDGPDGPAYVAKRGVSYLARKARAVVLPVGAWTRQALQLRRWDRYLVPLPYARIQVVVGEPIWAETQQSDDDLLAQLRPALHAARAQAIALAD